MPNWTFLARVCQGTTHLVWSRSGFYNPQQENKLLPSRTSRFPLRDCPSAKSWAGEQAQNRLQECYLRLPACQPRPGVDASAGPSASTGKYASSILPLKNSPETDFSLVGAISLQYNFSSETNSTVLCQYKKHLSAVQGGGSVDSGNISCVCPLAGILDPENQSFFLPLKSKVNKHKVTEPVTRKSCVRPGFT